jgi:hypothetical protein
VPPAEIVPPSVHRHEKFEKHLLTRLARYGLLLNDNADATRCGAHVRTAVEPRLDNSTSSDGAHLGPQPSNGWDMVRTEKPSRTKPMSHVPNMPRDARYAVGSVEQPVEQIDSQPPLPPPLAMTTTQAPPRARQPGDPPTRERKLKTTTFEQVDAARDLIRPQPLPKHKARKFGASAIVFEPDHTPADAEARLDPSSPPRTRRKPDPAPRSASADEKQRQQNIRAVRAEISPQPTLAAPASDAADDSPASPPASSALSDAEIEQIARLVQDKYSPILNIDQAAEVSKLARQTIRERVCHGLYAQSVVRGRPLRFWAHRFVREVMRP